MNDYQAILHPFPQLEDFQDAIKGIGLTIFKQYELTPVWNQSAIMDAYALWTAEVNRNSRELHNIRDSEAGLAGKPSIPSHLKKAGALTSALNRTKPLRDLQRKLSYAPDTRSDFQKKIVEVYMNEFFAFELSRNAFLVADQQREKMASYDEFLEYTGLSESEIVSEELVNDICFYLRSRAPSSTSLYMMFKALYASSYAWRRKKG